MRSQENTKCFEFVYYEDEPGVIVYEGDLEDDLIQFGVEPEIVDSLKKRKLQTIPKKGVRTKSWTL